MLHITDPRCVPLGMRHPQAVPGLLMPGPGHGMLGPGPPRHPRVVVPGAVLGRGVPLGGQHGQHLGHLGQGPGLGQPPGHSIYVEDQMDQLGGKLDMLENELRYAWRALDVLSQEYIKMWERMEKLEGLLTEQQTVITQLIDLYTADSSDNAENEFDSNGRDISNFSNFGGRAPDESFYKALNMVHQNSCPSNGDNLATISNISNMSRPGSNMSNYSTANLANVEKSPKSTKSPKPQPKGPKDIEYIDNMAAMLAAGQGVKVAGQIIREDSEGDLKSMSSSMRSTQSGTSDVAEFPVPADTSPTYENLVSAGTLVTPVAGPGPAHKRKLPQLPPGQQQDSRRTRKDGYVESGSRLGLAPAPLQTSDPNIQVFPSAAGNVQSEVSYDTYPRRKKKKDKQQKKKESEETVPADSPLTVIDGNYSFNISGEAAAGQQRQAANSGDNQARVGQERRPSAGQEQTRARQHSDKQIKAAAAHGQGLVKTDSFANVQQQQQQQPQQQSRAVVEDTPSDNSLTRASANSLFQQIQAREAETGGQLGQAKGRKLSLKEKRKLRAERDLTEFLPRALEPQESQEPAAPAPVFRKPEHHSNSESDVSMRSDISPKRDSDDVEQLLAANGVAVTDPQQRGRPGPGQPQQLGAKPNSREFAVSRALGKYRQKKKERESSNSDSQDELELGCDGSRGGIESTLKSLDAKLAEIEESEEPARSISVADAKTSIPVEKVQNQLNKFEEAGVKPIEVAPSARPISRKVSEDSIDTEDEWYRHEMTRLKRMEAEQKAGGLMGSLVGELGRKLIPQQDVASKDVSKVGQPPDRPPGEPPDKRIEAVKRVQRRSSKKQLLRKSTASTEKSTDGDDSSVTGSADDDSDTQSGEDFIEEEEEDSDRRRSREVEPTKRPGNFQQPLNISGNLKPDLLEELTAAAAEDHYPEHLKNGYFGEDGIWYDDHGETGYWGEDGEWYDYMDEIGYYSDSGEWREYDYSTGYWDDDGEWQTKEPAKPASATQQNPSKEADHFLWVSEEGTNEFANDQVPSSELATRMVIGKPVSGFTETASLVRRALLLGNITQQQQHCHTNINSINNNITTNGNYSEPEEEEQEPQPIHQNNIVTTNEEVVTNQPEPILAVHEEVADEGGGGGGGRWGSIMRRHEILLLVRHRQ